MNKEELTRAKAMTSIPIASYLFGYDSSDISEGEIQYRLEEDDEVKARLTAAGDAGRAEVEKAVREEVYRDSFIYEQAFDDLCENLTEELRTLTKTQTGDAMYFRLTVSSFGWRGQDGHKYVRVQDGRELIRALLPNCECTYRFFKVKHGKKLAMQNFHHDSPVGKEWYVITPCAASTYEARRST